MKNTIKVERARMNITQEELARAIGVSRQTIISVESGKYIPSTILSLKMARYFNRPVEELFILEKDD